MKKGPIDNIAASVHRRLLNKARETGRPFNELLQYFAMERFLYRLSQSPHADKFVLKGALMFTAWRMPFSRSTMDIDLLGQMDNSIDILTDVIKEVCLQDVEPDGIAFDAAGIEGQRIIENADYEGLRIRFRGNLGTARIVIRLDIGFGDVVIPAAEAMEYPTILDLPAPIIRGYSKESVVAEKFEIMVKLGMLNSRMKDFFDIWFLSRRFNFDGSNLAEAVMKTFSNRGTIIPSTPVALSANFAEDPSKKTQWRGFIRKNRQEDIPQDFNVVIEDIAGFLKPIVDSLVVGHSFKGTWTAPGPWFLL